MKTPEQIAHQIYREGITLPTNPNGADLRALMVRAIEADRAQRENDGTVHAAVIAALWDRADGMFVSGEPNTAASAAQWVEDYPDEFWDEYAGPMLDEIEARFQ